ncbi:hypothetical protein ACNKU7_11465 [Microbulbifer sp. SA54]|uniref:hypothetical protein n=1 Tax=Microbulbifer sp. SA54 TaxID=3401577 RepID=UPI003AB01525
MNLTWTENKTLSQPAGDTGQRSEYVIHSSTIEKTSDDGVQRAIDACIDKACTLLPRNIRDDSRYLLFGWDAVNSTLTIVVTDDSKEKDSPDIVQCRFSSLVEKMNSESADPDHSQHSAADELADNIQYWIKDYLTTCAPFLRYSLIAAFYRESRSSCALL